MAGLVPPYAENSRQPLKKQAEPPAEWHLNIDNTTPTALVGFQIDAPQSGKPMFYCANCQALIGCADGHLHIGELGFERSTTLYHLRAGCGAGTQWPDGHKVLRAAPRRASTRAFHCSGCHAVIAYTDESQLIIGEYAIDQVVTITHERESCGKKTTWRPAR